MHAKPTLPTPRTLSEVTELLARFVASFDLADRPDGEPPSLWLEESARPVVLAEHEVAKLVMAMRGAISIAELLAQDADGRHDAAVNGEQDAAQGPLLHASKAEGLAVALVALLRGADDLVRDRVCLMQDAVDEARKRMVDGHG